VQNTFGIKAVPAILSGDRKELEESNEKANNGD